MIALAERLDVTEIATLDPPALRRGRVSALEHEMRQVRQDAAAASVYRLIAEGAFPAIRIRTRLVVPAKAIEDMAEAAVERSVVDSAGWPSRR